MNDAFRTETLIVLWLLCAVAVASTVETLVLEPVEFAVDQEAR